MSAKETPRICICLPDDDGGSCIRENCLCPCHSVSQPENDCNYADIRNLVVTEQADFEAGSSEWCCYASLLDRLDELATKYGRKP